MNTALNSINGSKNVLVITAKAVDKDKASDVYIVAKGRKLRL